MDLKKEIKLSDLVPKRKPKVPKPEADEAQKEKKRKKPKKPKTPLLKKDLSFKRKPKAKREPVEEDEQPKKKRSKRAPRDGARTKRAKKLVGLKIGGSQLAAARVVNNGSPELVQVAREKLDHGLVVGGELREPELLSEQLRAFFRKNKLPRQNVRLGIANNRIGVRVFEIAGVDDPKQLENAIRYRAQEVLPIPMEEAVLDYHVLSESTDAEGATTRRILLVVAYRDLV